MIEIHSEYCPRISSFDVTALISCKDTRADLLIVDIRSSSEYVLLFTLIMIIIIIIIVYLILKFYVLIIIEIDLQTLGTNRIN